MDVIAKESRLVGTTAAISFPVISTGGLPTAGRSGEICSRMEVNYRLQPDPLRQAP